MTVVRSSADQGGAVDALLWRWVDHVDRNGEMGMRRPEWFAQAGELALAEEVTWFGMTTSGGWYHDDLPAGLSRAPVYAGYSWHQQESGPPVARAGIVVVPLADPDRIAAAEWSDEYGGYEPAPVDGYAVLCSSPFDPVTGGDRAAGAALGEARRIIAAGDAEGRRANYAEIVTDPDRGGNALFFPVVGEEREGYEAVEPDGTIVCLCFIAYDFL